MTLIYSVESSGAWNLIIYNSYELMCQGHIHYLKAHQRILTLLRLSTIILPRNAVHEARNEHHLYDSGYADYAVAAATAATGADFVIRCSTDYNFRIVHDFIERGGTDEDATLLVTKRGWPLELRVRLVKVDLPSG